MHAYISLPSGVSGDNRPGRVGWGVYVCLRGQTVWAPRRPFNEAVEAQGSWSTTAHPARVDHLCGGVCSETIVGMCGSGAVEASTAVTVFLQGKTKDKDVTGSKWSSPLPAPAFSK